MKKSYKTMTAIPIIAIMILALAACGKGSSAAPTAASSTSAGTAAPPGQSGEMPANQLAFGTFYLEETDLAVTQDQAAELLPLWQMLNALYNSETSAQAEISAVMAQLNKTMTSEQLQAIRDMNLAPEQMTELMQSLGIEMQPRTSNQETGGQAPTGGFPGGQGQPSTGGFPGGQGGQGQPPAGMQNFSEADIQALRATREASGDTGGGFMGRVNTAILEKLIELLQNRAAGK